MALFDDEKPAAKPAHAVGEALDTLSIEEIDRRIALLRGEIERLERERTQKEAAQSAAHAVFKS